MAARGALEWIGALEARLVLDVKYQTCSLWGENGMGTRQEG